MSSLNEQLYGKEFHDKQQAFFAELKQIEAKYIDWFKERNGKPRQEHDIIENHYMMQWDGHQVGFGFKKDSPLPQEIKDEGLTVFKKYFP